MINDMLQEKNALLRTARLRDITEDWAKAMQDYQILADKYPQDPFVLEPLARVQGKMGLLQARAETLAKAIWAYRRIGMARKAELLEQKLGGSLASA